MVEAADDRVGRAWHRAAQKLGLVLFDPGVLFGRHLEGTIGHFQVRVATQGEKTSIVIRDGRPAALSGLRWRTNVSRAAPDRVMTGDQFFDDQVAVHGDRVAVAAFCNQSRRRSILLATTGAGTFEDGTLALDLPTRLVTTPALVSAVRTAVALARRMAGPRSLAASLAASARRDPVPAVRLNCLERLAESFPRAARPVLRAAMRDPDGAVRLGAALALGAEGRTALLGLARDARLDEATQMRAIATLDHPPVQELSHILARAMRCGRRAVALAAVAALGDNRTSGAVVALAPLVAASDPGIRVSAIRALGATDQPAAQDALIEALGSDASGAREAAAQALGELGTVTAVPALRAASDAHPLKVGFRRLARRAIQAIKARAGGAAPGQLSVADDDHAGGLSLASSDTGRLTLHDAGAAGEPARRLAAGARPKTTARSKRR